jgi:hypothetical protein
MLRQLFCALLQVSVSAIPLEWLTYINTAVVGEHQAKQGLRRFHVFLRVVLGLLAMSDALVLIAYQVTIMINNSSHSKLLKYSNMSHATSLGVCLAVAIYVLLCSTWLIFRAKRLHWQS